MSTGPFRFDYGKKASISLYTFKIAFKKAVDFQRLKKFFGISDHSKSLIGSVSQASHNANKQLVRKGSFDAFEF